MYDAIGGARLKFRAMAEHMDRLQDTVDGWLEEQTEVATLIGHPNSQRTKYVFRIEKLIPYPAEEWGIILGDAVHCLRSGLDQIMWGFIPEAKNRTDRTQFPICLTEREWIVDAPRMYWGASTAFIGLLEKTQPYHRGDVNAAKEHPFAILRALSNLDKHRAIPSIALVADETDAAVVAKEGIKNWPSLVFKKGKPYKEDAVIAEAKIITDESGLEPYMQVKVNAAFDIAFGVIPDLPKLYARPVADVMTEVAEYGARLINMLTEAWNLAVEATHTEEERERAVAEARRRYD